MATDKLVMKAIERVVIQLNCATAYIGEIEGELLDPEGHEKALTKASDAVEKIEVAQSWLAAIKGHQ